MVFKRPGNSRDGQSGRSSNRPSKGDDQTKKSFSPSRGRSSKSSDTAGSGPQKRYSSERSGEKRSFPSSEGKPYANRSSRDDDRPKSSFTGGEKKSFAPKRPYSGRPTDTDAPKRSFDNGPSGDRKSFTPRAKPYSGRPTSDERPPKSFSNDPSRERKFTSPKSTERSAEKKFGDRPQATGFKKREGDLKDKPFRKSDDRGSSKPKYDKITVDRDAPVRTLRGRKPVEKKDTGLIRLNRYIANAGICSRRKADELILAGVVAVNGEVVTELGSKVDPMKDEIKYNGETLRREKMTYVLLNKPKDYITTTEDPQERRTVMHLVEKASRERIYPVGRLDRNTTGLLLMTNDGDLADKLSHPRSNIVKLYQAELNKNLSQGDLNKIQFGLELEDGLIKPDAVSYVQGGSKREIGIQIHSGKNRIVRRIFEHLGYEVVKLDRVVYANLTKKDLPRGRWRYLDEAEVIQLKHLIK
jgi:23S rRNA pseudouridine2605 synthase